MRAFTRSSIVPHSPRTAIIRAGVLVAFLGLMFGWITRGAAEESDDANIARLKDPDVEERLQALRELGTSLDPRLPEAMRVLLADEGNSVRRLAARGVGSRWWQIPKEKIPTYVKALKRNAKSEQGDEVNMVNRALGLLQRDYSGTMFVRSPNRRWVIYERHGQPCLIDTKTGTEELLGWSSEGGGRLDAAWGNGTLESSVHWHGKREIAALSILLNRRTTTMWFWQHQGGLKRFEPEEIVKALGYREADRQLVGGFYTEAKGWKGDDFRFEATFAMKGKDEPTEQTAMLAWNVAKKNLRVLAR